MTIVIVTVICIYISSELELLELLEMREMRWSWWRIIAGVSSVYDHAGPGAALYRAQALGSPAQLGDSSGGGGTQEEHRRHKVISLARDTSIGGDKQGHF